MQIQLHVAAQGLDRIACRVIRSEVDRWELYAALDLLLEEFGDALTEHRQLEIRTLIHDLGSKRQD